MERVTQELKNGMAEELLKWIPALTLFLGSLEGPNVPPPRLSFLIPTAHLGVVLIRWRD